MPASMGAGLAIGIGSGLAIGIGSGRATGKKEGEAAALKRVEENIRELARAGGLTIHAEGREMTVEELVAAVIGRDPA